MNTIKVYDWPTALRFRREGIAYQHASVSGLEYFTGRPQGQTIALPKRLMGGGGGPLQYKGISEVVRFALSPANLVRMPRPRWCRRKSAAVRAMSDAPSVVWNDAFWIEDTVWDNPNEVSGTYNVGDTAITFISVPPNALIFETGDIVDIADTHYMASRNAYSDADGTVTLDLVRGLETAVDSSSVLRTPATHLFQVNFPKAEDRDFGAAYDWEAEFVEVFESDYPEETTFENVQFTF